MADEAHIPRRAFHQADCRTGQPGSQMRRLGMRSRVTTVAGISVGILSASLALALAQTGAATPKLADGHPDLNGQWYHRIGPPAPQIKPGQSYDAAIAKPIGIAQFNPGKPVYKPEFVAKVKDLDERQVETDPAWYCN